MSFRPPGRAEGVRDIESIRCWLSCRRWRVARRHEALVEHSRGIDRAPVSFKNAIERWGAGAGAQGEIPGRSWRRPDRADPHAARARHGPSPPIRTIEALLIIAATISSRQRELRRLSAGTTSYNCQPFSRMLPAFNKSKSPAACERLRSVNETRAADACANVYCLRRAPARIELLGTLVASAVPRALALR